MKAKSRRRRGQLQDIREAGVSRSSDEDRGPQIMQCMSGWSLRRIKCKFRPLAHLHGLEQVTLNPLFSTPHG